MIVLDADLVVFTEIVLHVGPQRIEDALKKQEGKKKPGGGLLFRCRRTSPKRPSGYCRAQAHIPSFLLIHWSAEGCGITAEGMPTCSQGAEHTVVLEKVEERGREAPL